MLNPLVEDANQDADGDRFSNLLLLGERARTLSMTKIGIARY
jgi:hypothetical protein